MASIARLTRRAAAVALAASVAVARGLDAQPPVSPDTASTGPRAATLRAAFAGVPSGTRVRVAWRDGAPALEGRWERLAGDTLVVRVPRAAEPTRAPLDAVQRLHVKVGDHLGRGARVGGGLGAIVLGGLSVMLMRGLCDRSDCRFRRDEWNGVAGAAAVGAIAGAVTGAVIGSAVPRWRVVAP